MTLSMLLSIAVVLTWAILAYALAKFWLVLLLVSTKSYTVEIKNKIIVKKIDHRKF